MTFLALTPRRAASRERLCELLWGNRSLQDARGQLRQTIWQIRTILGSESLTSSDAGVALNLGIRIDAEGFEKFLRENRVDDAVELYVGDFFSGYAAPGARGFEDWLDGERTRLRSLYVQTIDLIARREIESGHWQDAIKLGTLLRERDPFGQTAWRILLEARFLAHDIVGAVANAEHFERWSQEEDILPDRSLRELLSAIRKPRTAANENDSARLVGELVGRETEFRSLNDAWQSAATKGALLLWVAGDAGVGKTRLLQDFATRLSLQSATVQYVRANPGERFIAFSFLAAIAERLAQLPGSSGVSPVTASTLVALNPALSNVFRDTKPLAEAPGSREAGLALLETITAISEDEPLALLLDDLHWSDRESSEAIALIGGRLGQQTVLLVAAARPGYSGLAMFEGSTILTLTPLLARNVHDLVSSIGRLPDEEWTEHLALRLQVASHGNPLQLLETLRFACDTNLLTLTDEQWNCSDPAKLFGALEDSQAVSRRLCHLSKSARNLLTCLAIAGIPLPRSIVADALEISESCTPAIATELETAGFLVSEGGELSLAHDSIGEMVLQDLSESDRAETGRPLARALGSRPERHWKRISLPLLVEFGERDTVQTVSTELLRAFPSSTRPIESQLLEILGPNVSLTVAAQVRRSLPFNLRFRRFRSYAIAISAVAALVAIGAWSTFKRSNIATTDNSVLLIFTPQEGNRTEVKSMDLSLDNWDPQKPLLIANTASLGNLRRQEPNSADFAAQPGSSSWVDYTVYPDSGNVEIQLLDVHGGKRRLTTAHGDDRGGSFSPDGKQLAFFTSRWSPKGWSAIAILDMATLKVRRLTNDAGNSEVPTWSPDGTTIAYTHNFPDSSHGKSICTIAVDGSHQHCRRSSLRGGIYGWIDPHRIIVDPIEENAQRLIEVFDLSSGAHAPTRFASSYVSIDPGGRWILGRDQRPSRRGVWQIAPTSRLDAIRTISISGNRSDFRFGMPHLPGEFIDSVFIERPRGPLSIGVPHQLRLQALTRAGVQITPSMVQWKSDDPRVDVDSLGIVMGTKPGNVIITASAGGWRSASSVVTLGAAVVQQVMLEDWNGGWNSRWMLFGEPFPVVERTASSGMFLTNGDDNFLSGAYTRQAFRASQGIAVDFNISTPITATQWQELSVSIASVSDSLGLASWDHRTGYSKFFAGEDCGFSFPGSEGPRAWETLPWFPELVRVNPNLARIISTGAEYKVRIQRFPDGRCGRAINGYALEIMESDVPSYFPKRIVIQGKNVGTKFKVGPVTIRTGVPNDIDWATLEFNGRSWTARPRTPKRK